MLRAKVKTTGLKLVSPSRAKPRALREQLAEKDAALAVCVGLHNKIAAIEEKLRIADVDDQPQSQPDLFGQLLQANKELEGFMANLPESAKQAANVIEAARKLNREHNYSMNGMRVANCLCVVCQAVREMK